MGWQWSEDVKPLWEQRPRPHVQALGLYDNEDELHLEVHPDCTGGFDLTKEEAATLAGILTWWVENRHLED